MMQQYLALKAEVPSALLLFRMGDFYELFLEDAGIAAGALDIALTHRGEHLGKPLPMCGVPIHAHEAYVARLVKAGHAVAIAEQTEDPAEAKKRGSKSIVNRAIVRVITPGTLTEERLLDGRRANWLLSLFPGPAEVGLAWADISTGDLWLGAVLPSALADEIARIGPAEVLAPEGAGHAELPRAAFDSVAAEKRLAARLGVSTLDGFGQFPRAALAAAGGLLSHIEMTARGAAVLLKPPRLHLPGAAMAIDGATRRSLELTDGPTSLLAAIDLTVTAGGGRLLAGELAAPLANLRAIEDRLDLVQWFAADADLRDEARRILKAAPDLARALGRIAAGRGSPRDLAALRDGLRAARGLGGLLDSASAGGAPPALDPLRMGLEPPSALLALLEAALVESPPLQPNDGGVILPGYDAALDELRLLAADSRAAIAALEGDLRARTGVQTLRVKHNNVIGYHVEVAPKAADPLMADPGFFHRQTLGNAMRFDTEALRGLASRIAQAQAHALAAEAAHLETMRADVLATAAVIGRVADALAALDRASALGELAVREGLVRPRLTQGMEFRIVAGRHPVVEAALRRKGEAFVPNDCALEGEARVWLVTGPNMGGKSTFLRQNALIAVLAQAGSFVPAAEATIGLVDRLYSRVGASDSLAEGRSTFMVEMVETAAILSQATERSFVILDEVGRGTSTYDGLALAWAVAEAVHETNRCRCLFATHYHEMARLGETCEALSLHHVRAREWKGDLVLLHELAEGPADRSYGLAVARLAGVPPKVISRAKSVLEKLEKGRAETGGLAAGLGDLPLFAAAQEAQEEQCDVLRDKLRDMDIDALSPRDALEILYDLKREAGTES